MDEDTLAWRRKQLKQAGYDGVYVKVLAEDQEVDLHVACNLLEEGCPPKTAVLILSS